VLKVSRHRFDSLAESDQKDFKSWYSQLPYMTCIKVGYNVKIARQVRLLCLWARHLTGLPLPMSGHGRGAGGRPPWIFICGTNIVDRGLKRPFLLFFGPVFPLFPHPLKEAK